MFKQNYEYLCDCARGAIFSLLKCIRNALLLPPQCMFHLFQTLIEPILLYNNDVWGLSTCAGNKLNSVMLSFIRNALHVKSTTCNVIGVGETGQILQSHKSYMNVFAYFVRWRDLPKIYVCMERFWWIRKVTSTWFLKLVQQSCWAFSEVRNKLIWYIK